MKNSFLLLGAFIIHNIVYSQSILTEKTKYHVQRMASNKGYEALFPMVCGDGITKKNRGFIKNDVPNPAFKGPF